MNLADFQGIRRGLQINAVPVTSQARSVFEDALRQELLASGVFTDLEVGSTGEEEHLLVALGGYRADVRDDEVAGVVQRAWTEIAFDHWQAHAFLSDEGHVELQAATLDRPGGRYLTLHLVVQRTTAPVAAEGELPQQRDARSTGQSRVRV